VIRNIAHRGFSGKYPENTLLAFRKALEAGADGIELDVQLTRDGEVVILHDETLDRTTDGSGPVGEHTLSQLRRLDASGSFRGRWGVNPIPTLEEYFQLIQGREVLTNIELKNGVLPYPGLEERVLEIVDRWGRRDQVILSSFNHPSVMRVKALAPEIRCGFLEESRLLDPAGYCAGHGVECWHPFWRTLTPEDAAGLRARGVAVHPWTVNRREDMEEMLRLGADGIITNYPDLLEELRRGRG
jgi:glycerophosphoryl diester phosphodiesterase